MQPLAQRIERQITEAVKALLILGALILGVWMIFSDREPVKYPDWDMDRCQADWDDFFSRAGRVAPPMSQEWLARCLPPSPGGTPVATGQ